jgi:hypothetical protein
MKIRFLSVLLLLLGHTLCFGQNELLFSPIGITTDPANAFFNGSELSAINGSGLENISGIPYIPATLGDASNAFHVTSADETKATYLANGGATAAIWTFHFDQPRDISGMVLWMPCAAYNAGDAPFKVIQISGNDCNQTFTETIDFENVGGLPSQNSRVVTFPNTHVQVTSVDLRIIEVWYDSTHAAGCGAFGYGVYDVANDTVPSLYNTMLGEIMFIEDDDPSFFTTVELIVSNDNFCGDCAPDSFTVVNNVDGTVSGPFNTVGCPDTLDICVSNNDSYDLIGSNGVVISNAISNGAVNYPNGVGPFQLGNSALYSQIDFVVSNESLCGGCEPLRVKLISTSGGESYGAFDVEDCEEVISLCIENPGSYDLISSDGVIFPNAIVNGVVNYPGGVAPFQFGAAASTFIGTVITNANSYINTAEMWEGRYFVEANVIVRVDGVELDLTNVDIIFGECAGMEFYDGGHLRANNSVFRPCNINGVWKGLHFSSPGEFDNIINESTFKNAEIALYFENYTDGVVSNNLFSNCNQGVSTRNVRGFNHPISGNRFVLDDFYPEYTRCYENTDISIAYGINMNSTAMLGEIAHNDFINSISNLGVLHTYGIYATNSGGQYSENTFTDLQSPIEIVNAARATYIENNEIEINRDLGAAACISVLNTMGPVIEISNNEINCNYGLSAANGGIYAGKSGILTIYGNHIRGFWNGIRMQRTRGVNITRNTIVDAERNGISLQNEGPWVNFITCNDITMASYNGTRGINLQNNMFTTQVTSNCVKNSNIAIRLTGSGAIPYIRNNFLYNYSSFGIRNAGHTGNIGTIADPGMNTCWSNDNTAVDIFSTIPIQIADNFGVFNISFATVQMTSANPYHSTASCATQIFNMPSQGNLNTNLSCDNAADLIVPIVNQPGGFFLSQNYEAELTRSIDPFNQINMILLSVENVDESMLNAMMAQSDLTENEVALLKFNFSFKTSDYVNATIALGSFNAGSTQEEQLKEIYRLNLELALNSYELQAADINFLMLVAAGEIEMANLAIATMRDGTIHPSHRYEFEDNADEASDLEIRRIGDDELSVNMYPNPTTGLVYIDLIANSAASSTVELRDVTGKLITDYTLNQVSGRFELNVQALSNGVYFVTLSNSEATTTSKLVKY